MHDIFLIFSSTVQLKHFIMKPLFFYYVIFIVHNITNPMPV